MHYSLPVLDAVTNRYALFGLIFESEEPIPGISPVACDGMEAVRIAFGPTPHGIPHPQFDDGAVQADGDSYLFTFPGLVRLFIERDRRILVERLPGWDPVRLWTVVLGVGASIVGLRRGQIPLHASSIALPGGCVAFAGQSGAGKSTLAAALVARGHALFADDLCLISPSVAGPPTIGRGIAELRLTDEAVGILGWDAVPPFARQPDAGKSVFRRADAVPATAPLRRIYTLHFAEPDGLASGIHPIVGVEAMQALLVSLRIRGGMLGVGAADRIFAQIAAASASIAMFRFVRPRDHARAGEAIDQLTAHFASLMEQG